MFIVFYFGLFVKKYANLLSSVIFKITVIVFTFGLLGFGIWGLFVTPTRFGMFYQMSVFGDIFP